MTSPTPTAADPRVGRIRTGRTVAAMVAADSFPPIADRVEQMLSHGRPITLIRRTDGPDPATVPEVFCGLTVLDVTRRDPADGQPGSFVVDLAGGGRYLGGFGFSSRLDTEAQAQDLFREAPSGRVGLVRVYLVGGLTAGRFGDGPAVDDRIVITRWSDAGLWSQFVVAFDSYTGRDVSGGDERA